VLRRDSDVEKGPPWPTMVSEVMGGQRGGGVLRRGVLSGPEEMAVELSAASMPEQGKKESEGEPAWWRHGENGVRHLGSCTGAVETGAGRVVSGVMWE
jgi:hypothetical protein